MIEWTEHFDLARSMAAALLVKLPPGQAGLEELEQDALIGLHAAARAFDESRGVAFSTYAQPRIRGAMLDGLRERDALSRTDRRHGRASPRSLSAFRSAETDEEADLPDLSAAQPWHALRDSEVLDRVAQLFHDPRLAHIVRRYFGDGLTLREVAGELELSESRVSQLLSHAMRIARGYASVSDEGELLFSQRTNRRSSMHGTDNQNGNGTNLAKRPPSAAATIDVSPAVEQLQELPPWLKAMREAMSTSISGDDIKAIMQQQVEKARTGDRNAANFVMTQAHKMMQAGVDRRPVTITQNNYYDSPRPDAPIEPGDDADGSDIRKLRARARAGAPITGRPEDRRVRPVSDEEEKEMRRRQEADQDERAA